jgi:hypothetical protein
MGCIVRGDARQDVQRDPHGFLVKDTVTVLDVALPPSEMTSHTNRAVFVSPAAKPVTVKSVVGELRSLMPMTSPAILAH